MVELRELSDSCINIILSHCKINVHEVELKVNSYSASHDS